MLQKIDPNAFFPRFLRTDRAGYALVKALEAGMNDFLKIAQSGLDAWGNPEKMPEWRLDELAREYNILYDAEADIAVKRQWIADAISFYSLYGTAAGMVKYLESRFDNVRVEEAASYGGEPFHFRVTIDEEYSADVLAWAQTVANNIKNVRSVLDAIRFSGGNSHAEVIFDAEPSGGEVFVTAETIV